MKAIRYSNDGMDIADIILCRGYLIDKPDNVAAVSNSNVILRCARNSSKALSWLHGDTTVFNGYTVIQSYPRCSVVGREGRYDLSINSLQMQDAGMYTCIVTDSSKATAQVVVIGVYKQ